MGSPSLLAISSTVIFLSGFIFLYFMGIILSLESDTFDWTAARKQRVSIACYVSGSIYLVLAIIAYLYNFHHNRLPHQLRISYIVSSFVDLIRRVLRGGVEEARNNFSRSFRQGIPSEETQRLHAELPVSTYASQRKSSDHSSMMHFSSTQVSMPKNEISGVWQGSPYISGCSTGNPLPPPTQKPLHSENMASTAYSSQQRTSSMGFGQVEMRPMSPNSIITQHQVLRR